jgi:hypothetical protein
MRFKMDLKMDLKMNLKTHLIKACSLVRGLILLYPTKKNCIDIMHIYSLVICIKPNADIRHKLCIYMQVFVE